jgi:hypothetical protein
VAKRLIEKLRNRLDRERNLIERFLAFAGTAVARIMAAGLC